MVLWKPFEKNNPTIVSNILYINEEEIYPAYISKQNLTCEKQIILLMISIITWNNFLFKLLFKLSII